MEPQQLATKVAQLESRVATLEDEGKIVKGEVKQILTEIRAAILVRDNPFEADGGLYGGPQSGMSTSSVHVVSTAPPEPVAKVELVMPKAEKEPEPAPEPEPEPLHEPEPEPQPAPPPPAPAAREPAVLRPIAAPPPAPAPAEPPQWTLLTIAGLSAWAEEAMRRLGSLRLEILLDLCEAAGHLTPEARTALARVTELDIPEPASAPSTNETVVILRQLDALVNDDEDYGSVRLRRAG